MRPWRILTLGRTDVLLHPAMLVFALYALLTGHALFWGMATLSILLHEAAHAATAALWGSPPQHIEVTPLGAVMRLEDEGQLPPFKRLTMLLAGPGMTLLLCTLAIFLTKAGALQPGIGRVLFISNLGILLMNLLPALPLDGGRILSMLLGLALPVHAVHRAMRVTGNILGLSLVLLNLYITWTLGGWNLSLAFAGCCIMYASSAGTTTRAMAELRAFLDRKILLEGQGSRRMVCVAVLGNQPLRHVLKRLPPRSIALYQVFEPGTMRSRGTVTEYKAVQQYLSHPDTTFGEVTEQANFGKK